MYRVEYGWCCEEGSDFATFEEALTFYKGFLAGFGGHGIKGESFRLVNPDNIDGAEDASAAAQHGLTRSEWEQVEAVG